MGNILFVTLDQMRADLVTGRLAGAARLPNLARLREEAVTFANHFTVTTPCGPARASLLTGLYAMTHRSVRNGAPLAAHLTNLALELRKAGREPLLFGYTDVSPDPRTKPAADPDLKSYEGLLPGFTEVVTMRLEANSFPWLADLAGKGYDVSDYETLIGAKARNAEEKPGDPAIYSAEDSDTAFLTDQALRHLGLRHGQGQDWIAHLTYIRPHPPLVAPAPWNRLVPPEAIPPAAATGDLAAERAVHPVIDAQFSEPSGRSLYPGFDGDAGAMEEATRQTLRSVYLGLAAEVDHHLGRIFDWLRDSGQWNDTLIVVTSDHGEMLGDHFAWGKQTIYDAAFRIPLILRDPGARSAEGTTVEALTESVDIAPTILDWIGAAAPDGFDGRSLLPFLRGAAPDDWRDHVFMEIDFGEPGNPTTVQRRLGLSLSAANAAILRETRWKYVHFNGGLPPLLFDLDADPDETRDLAGDPGHAATLARLARKMLDHRMTHADRALSGIAITPEGPRRD